MSESFVRMSAVGDFLTGIMCVFVPSQEMTPCSEAKAIFTKENGLCCNRLSKPNRVMFKFKNGTVLPGTNFELQWLPFDRWQVECHSPSMWSLFWLPQKMAHGLHELNSV